MTKTLYYRISPANDDVVIAEPERAKYVAKLHDALSTSKTWGEFRQLMPFDEYMRIIEESVDSEGGVAAVPSDEEPFDSSDIWGYCDGDYPPWLQAELDQVIPSDILEKYAEVTSTMLNGNYYAIEKNVFPAMKSELERCGYELIDRTDLFFY